MIVIKNIELEKAASSIKKAEYIIDGNLFKTEQAAAHHFESQGYETIQSENFYWWYIAALLFWDVIFSKVEGAVALMEDGVQTAQHPQHDQNN